MSKTLFFFKSFFLIGLVFSCKTPQGEIENTPITNLRQVKIEKEIAARKAKIARALATETRNDKMNRLINQFNTDFMSKATFIDMGTLLFKSQPLLENLKENVWEKLDMVEDLDDLMKKLTKIESYSYIVNDALQIAEELRNARNEREVLFTVDKVIEKSRTYHL